MKTNYIAIDIGASSGRMMKSQLTADKRMTLTEIHRFKNGYTERDGVKYWDIKHLKREILNGLSKLKAGGVEVCVVGIDTWGVDYCLVDKEGDLIRDPISYRDQRTDKAVTSFSKKIPLKELYDRTGIQIQSFNTLFQLFVEDSQVLKQTDSVLLIPDYLGYYFTEEKVLERTNASTMQLLNRHSGELDEELLNLIGLTANQFPRLVDAGNVLGELQRDKFSDYDLPQATFVSVASHDTASAVIGTPATSDNWAFLSSGTWSLLGSELAQPIINFESEAENYTNEVGGFGTIRFLKNIMGLWLIQEVSRQEDYRFSYEELAEMARHSNFIAPKININDPIFLNPANMIEAIQSYCQERNLVVPQNTTELAVTIYQNLATCYGLEFKKLCQLTKREIKQLHIVGGGSNADLLNQLTADATGITVEAGPTEATAIGNLVMQMIALNKIGSVAEARELIRHSFDLKVYHPKKERK